MCFRINTNLYILVHSLKTSVDFQIHFHELLLWPENSSSILNRNRLHSHHISKNSICCRQDHHRPRPTVGTSSGLRCGASCLCTCALGNGSPLAGRVGLVTLSRQPLTSHVFSPSVLSSGFCGCWFRLFLLLHLLLWLLLRYCSCCCYCHNHYGSCVGRRCGWSSICICCFCCL
jgi:hypothetical protein